MTKNSKIVIGVAVAALAGIGAFLFVQYKRIMDFTLSFKGAKIKSFSPTSGLEAEIYFTVTNKSVLTITLKEQVYEIYFNNNYITTLSNGLSNVLPPKGSAVVGVNLTISDWKKLGQALKGTDILNLGSLPILIKERIKADVAGVPVTIKYDYKTNIKEMRS